jgi:hypothetical protein
MNAYESASRHVSGQRHGVVCERARGGYVSSVVGGYSHATCLLGLH